MQTTGLSRGFDDAVRELIHRSIIPPKAIADESGIPEPTLYGYADPEKRNELKARDVGRLTRITGNTVLIEELCRQCGGTFVRDPAPGRSLDIDVISALLTANRELSDFGEHAVSAAQASEQGRRLSEDHAILLQHKARKVAVAAYAMLASLGVVLTSAGCWTSGVGI